LNDATSYLLCLLNWRSGVIKFKCDGGSISSREGNIIDPEIEFEKKLNWEGRNEKSICGGLPIGKITWIRIRFVWWLTSLSQKPIRFRNLRLVPHWMRNSSTLPRLSSRLEIRMWVLSPERSTGVPGTQSICRSKRVCASLSWSA